MRMNTDQEVGRKLGAFTGVKLKVIKQKSLGRLSEFKSTVAST